MSDIYNLTNYTNSNTVLELANATNGLTGGLFMPMMLVLVLIISFVSLKAYDTKSAFISSSFITFVLGGVLFFVGLIAEGVVVFFFVLFLLAVGIAFFTE